MFARSSVIEPVSQRARTLSTPIYTSLWTALILGLPTFLVGFRLVAPLADGGLALTTSQLVLVVPIGVLLTAAVLGLVAWVGSNNGVPTELLLRPSLGVAGSWVAAVLKAAFVIAWAAVELQVTSSLISGGLAKIGVGEISERTGILLGGLVVGVFLLVGFHRMARIWFRHVAFWASLALVVTLLVRVIPASDVFRVASLPRSGAFWLGLDAILGLGILWFPLVADTARFTNNENAASTGIGSGFAVPAVIVIFSAGILGLAESVDPSPDPIIAFFTAGTAALMGALMLVWVVVGEADQPFIFVHGGAVAGSSLFPWLDRWVWSGVMLVLAITTALYVSQSDLFILLGFLPSVFAPMAGVLLADFFVVRRRRYLMDGLFQRSGPYAGINLLGLAVVIVGFAVYQWVDPTGPQSWLNVMDGLAPDVVWSERYGLPPGFLTLVVTFVLYAGLGWWKIEETVYMSKLRV